MELCHGVSVSTGQRCRRPALKGEQYCRWHQEGEDGASRSRERGSGGDGLKKGKGFYTSYFSGEELGELAALANTADIGAEIALLRLMIRRAVKEGADLKLITRGIDTLGRALKVQYGISGRAAQSLEEALAKVLDEIGNELGMTL